MALVAVLEAIQVKWPFHIHPAHVDHGLRPDSGEDAKWVRDTLRERYSLTTRVFSEHVVAQHGESVEMAARRVRYARLNQYAEEVGPGALIALAHHQADQAETILMRILTGTGIEGLQGMRPASGRLRRPLLEVAPELLRAYLDAIELPWREDPSNMDRRYLRNRLRLDVIPLLQRTVNPQVRQALTGLGHRAAETFGWVREGTQTFVDKHQLDLSRDPLVLPPDAKNLPAVVLADVFSQIAHLRGIRLEEVHLSPSLLRTTQWPQGWKVVWGRDSIEIIREDSGSFTPSSSWARPCREGTWNWNNGRLIVERRLYREPFSPKGTLVNANVWPEPWIRGWRAGDRMRPMGMKGRKKLQDIFVDRKVPRSLRALWPIVVGGPEPDAPILAVVGIAVDEQARAQQGDRVWDCWYTRTIKASPDGLVGAHKL